MAAPIARGQVNVTTQLNDIGRTGQNLNETILNTSNVNPTQFGKLFSRTVTGPIGAQPLYLSGITFNGVVHNVVFVATQPNQVYAFDADTNAGANANPLWHASLQSTAHGAAPGAKVYGDPGAPVGTSVIDPVSNTMYIASSTLEGSTPIYRLHALDVFSGREKFGGPVVISGSVAGSAPDGQGGTVTFLPLEHRQRPGLLLLNGIVYVSFGSNKETTSESWHGWIMAYNAATLAQTGLFCTSPNNGGSGIWMAGDALAADQLDPVNNPYGRIFMATGNGSFTVSPSGTDYGDSVVNLNLNNGAPTVSDSFTPSLAVYFGMHDQDQGSGGVLILPTQSGGSHPHLLVQAGKSGTLYLLDRENLGGYHSTDQVVQALSLAVGNTGAWNSPAYWNGNVYYWGTYDNLKQFPVANGLLSTQPITSTEKSTFPGATPSISANGNQEGIVWTIDADASPSAHSVLQAHDAGNVATTLYSSATNPGRDGAGPVFHFAIPTIANGKVYVGTNGELDVYGLLSSSQTAAPMIAPGSEAFISSVSVTISDSTPNAAIYYTTDGSAAGASSTPYMAPIVVQSSQTINAVAAAPGLAMSHQASAIFTQAQTPAPTFSPAAVAYSSPQSITINDVLAGATIYYTTDGTKPTTASSVYSGPITVAVSETVSAIAIGAGYAASRIASVSYTIGSGGSTVVDHSSGFSSVTDLNFVGAPAVTNNALQLTVAGTAGQVNAVWFTTPVNVQTFTTDFFFQETTATADGFTFTLQNAAGGLYALGSGGSGLGYQGIASSVAVKFDLFNNAGEGSNSTGIYANGAAPTVPAADMTESGVSLHRSNTLHAHLAYDGTTLTLTVTDAVSGASFTTSKSIDIPGILGANTAYAGFTAAAGAKAAATQTISNWTYAASPSSMAATPTFTPAPGTYAGAQSISINDATAGATLYYTSDGTTPTSSSSTVSGRISVSASETLKAIAAAPGYSTSAVSSAAYQIAAPAPTFMPGAGNYSSPQSVTINDAVSGATIYYTTDGTVPTTASTVYSGPINVGVSETLKAIAVAAGSSPSAVGSAAYKISTPLPTFMPAAGSYVGAQSVTIADAANGATIYYTTDGTVPTTASAVYGGAISVAVSENLKALAVAAGYSPSAVAVAIYKIH